MNALFLSILLSVAAPAFGLSCYRVTGYDRQVSIAHDADYCFSFYDYLNNQTAHSGISGTPERMERLTMDFREGTDCYYEHYELPYNSEDRAEGYTCRCFSDMCNFPFGLLEFKERKYTIRPLFKEMI